MEELEKLGIPEAEALDENAAPAEDAEAVIEELTAKIESLYKELEGKDVSLAALEEENKALKAQLDAAAKLPVFSAATEEKSDKFGEIKKIFRRK